MKTDYTRDKKEGQIQDERARDYASRFKAERYLTDGFCLHFHRNTELYCINRGQVSVLINGENRVLSGGQACVINRLESHSYEVEEPADITYFHVGVQYMDIFYRVYPQNEPARWLSAFALTGEDASDKIERAETAALRGEDASSCLQKEKYG